jgi:hypothetical protein
MDMGRQLHAPVASTLGEGFYDACEAEGMVGPRMECKESRKFSYHCQEWNMRPSSNYSLATDCYKHSRLINGELKIFSQTRNLNSSFIFKHRFSPSETCAVGGG